MPPSSGEAVALAASRPGDPAHRRPGHGQDHLPPGHAGPFRASWDWRRRWLPPPGRAAKRLASCAGWRRSTIHRLLGPGYDEATGRLAFLPTTRMSR